MIKISKMYKLSGGCNWLHKCSECKFLLEVKTRTYCGRYPGNAIWSKNSIACKYFRENKTEEEGQLSIFDLM